MICNGNTPVAIAGIMGGLDSEIVDDTTTLTLESATFNAVSVRKSTVRLAHRTDASMRYEKCLDPEMTVTAIARFVYLLKKYDSDIKVVSSLTDEYAFRYDTVVLDFDKNFVDRYTGIEISNDRIVATLESLGFKVELNNDNFSVTVPSWRATKDVTIKADIIEEITRIYGYDNFEIHTTRSPLYPVRASVVKTTENKIKDMLVKRYNLHELHSYVWAYNDELKAIDIPVEDNVKLANATNPNIETLRNSIVPTQLCQIKSNLSFSNDFGIFEIGRVVDGVDDNNLCVEKKKLAITLYSRSRPMPTLYFDLRDILEVMADDLKHKKLTFAKKEAEHSYQHPRNLNTVYCDGVEIGEIGIAYPVVSKKIDKKASIVYAEIDVEAFAAIKNASIQYEEPSKFPSIDIDLSFVSDKFAPIAKAIENAKCKLIKNVEVTDVYEDENSKSITTRITFADPEKTLTREEVQGVSDSIVAELKANGIELKG